jgi:hypothetical protein
MDERALRGKRTMHKQVPPSYLKLQDDGTWTPVKSNGIGAGWELVAPVGTSPASFYFESYFDLGGYTLDDLTIYPEIALLQDPGVYTANASPNGRFAVIEILSQERLDIPDVIADYMDNGLPGSSISKEDWTQIIFGRYRLMTLTTIQAAPEIMTVAREVDFSSMEPTTVEKLWIYRIVIPTGLFDVDCEVEVPASTFVVRFESIEESDLHYMMRLKRSFELGTD